MTLYTTLTPAVPKHCIDMKLDFGCSAVRIFRLMWAFKGSWNFLVIWEFLLFSQDEKETASSRGIVLRAAAHRGESEWLVCFKWKYVKQKLDTLNTNMTHTKQYRSHTSTLTGQLLEETFNKSQLDDYRLWYFGLFNQLTKLTRHVLNDTRCPWYHYRPVFQQGNRKPTPRPYCQPTNSELTSLLNWHLSFFCLSFSAFSFSLSYLCLFLLIFLSGDL